MQHPWFSSINWEAIYEKQQPAPYKPQLDGETCTKHFMQEFKNIKLTPQEINSLKDVGKFENFTYGDPETELEVAEGTENI